MKHYDPFKELQQRSGIRPRLVSTALRRASGQWVRLCPRWFCTGSPAHWTSIEAKRT
jgi:hypothetical protein